MKRGALERTVSAGDRILIDTSVFIAYFEPAEATHTIAALLIDDFVQANRNVAIVSTVSAMELLVRPLRVAPAKAIHVHDFLTKTPNLHLQIVDLHVAAEAASLRATYGFKAPDALVVATGIVSQVNHLITNDAAWRTKLAPIKERVGVVELSRFM